MLIEPVISEKSTQLATEGKYSFKVNRNLNKNQIRKIVEQTFKVKVATVRTVNIKGGQKRTMTGKIKKVKPVKKAIIKLSGKDKIDIFETKKK